MLAVAVLQTDYAALTGLQLGVQDREVGAWNRAAEHAIMFFVAAAVSSSLELRDLALRLFPQRSRC